MKKKIEDLGLKVEGPTLLYVQLLNNDHQHYQRPLEEDNVEMMIKSKRYEDPDWVGIVAERPDGSLWILNGQHHTEAAQRSGATGLMYIKVLSEGWQTELVLFKLIQQWQKEKKSDNK